MADNAFVGEIGMGTTFLGGIVQAISSFVGGEAQKQMYDYQAAVAKVNAQIARQNAEYSRQIGEIQAAQVGMQGAQRQGQILAAQGASGLDVNSGSAPQVRASQKLVTGMDVAAVRANAAKTAYNYEVEGVQYQSQAALDTVAGQNARSAGMVGAMSSILGSVSSVSSEWLRGQSLGLWGQPSQSTSQPLGG